MVGSSKLYEFVMRRHCWKQPRLREDAMLVMGLWEEGLGSRQRNERSGMRQATGKQNPYEQKGNQKVEQNWKWKKPGSPCGLHSSRVPIAAAITCGHQTDSSFFIRLQNHHQIPTSKFLGSFQAFSLTDWPQYCSSSFRGRAATNSLHLHSAGSQLITQPPIL